MPSRRVPGSGDDPYAERRARIPLVEALADAFPEHDMIMSITATSGLQRDQIPTEPRPVGMWTFVLEYAVSQLKIDALLEEALKIYPDKPQLVAAVRHYREVRGW